MRIMNNISSLNSWRNLTMTDGSLGKSLERLSSGYRINRAADDVAGLAISENMRAQIKGLNQAVRNAQDGISLVQTAEGSLSEVHTMLQRMRELAVQAANGTLQPEDRSHIQTELDNLTKEVTRIANATKFNNKDLTDGSLQAGNIADVTLQIGPNGGQTMTFEIGGMDAYSLGISRDVLTGMVDNGTGALTVSALGSTGAASLSMTGTVTAGANVNSNKLYRVNYDNGGDDYQLQGSTDNGTTWGDIGGAVARVAGALTVGDGVGEDFSFTAPGAAVATETVNLTLNTAVAAGVASSVDSVGAGLVAGQYQLEYNSTTQKLQLMDMSNNNIGSSIDWVDGGTVTVGDTNTAKTVTLTLQGTAPTPVAPLATVTDVLTLNSSLGKVTIDDDGLLSTSLGVSAVDFGLESDSYMVYFDQVNSTVQLQTREGVAIGAAQAYTASSAITVGDAATNRTVTINTDAGAPAADAWAVIDVLNNESSAEAAQFNGGVKQLDARASAGLNVSSQTGAEDSLAAIDEAIAAVSTQRAQLGALQNRLEHTINNLQVVSENLVASESRIRDVDMAMEMTQFTKNQILMQAGTAMLAQANAKNQAVLQLLQ